jgi:hypothetical protein
MSGYSVTKLINLPLKWHRYLYGIRIKSVYEHKDGVSKFWTVRGQNRKYGNKLVMSQSDVETVV